MSARQHAANLPRLYLDMLDTMKVDRNDQLRLDAVAVAAGPGLSPCLDVSFCVLAWTAPAPGCLTGDGTYRSASDSPKASVRRIRCHWSP